MSINRSPDESSSTPNHENNTIKLMIKFTDSTTSSIQTNESSLPSPSDETKLYSISYSKPTPVPRCCSLFYTGVVVTTSIVTALALTCLQRYQSCLEEESSDSWMSSIFKADEPPPSFLECFLKGS
ncbi:MAG: hypothetical protein S4CHLAM7_03170 [Chlamydiae bacterium]|nr:hypothetical protein [Chlamydiota bacterium]